MLNGRALHALLLWAGPGHASVPSITLGPVCCTVSIHTRAALIATVEAIAVVVVIVLLTAAIISSGVLHSALTANHSVVAIVAAVGSCA